VWDLPCNCKECIKDPDTLQCPYLQWRNCRSVVMREAVQQLDVTYEGLEDVEDGDEEEEAES
jgi:Ran GTPase-activating protein (RanGAP) involved in mRNA processing and transport